MRLSTILVLMVSVHASGCRSAPTTTTFPYSLQFIDAQTKLPVEGVYISGIITGHYFNKRSNPATGRDLDVAPLSDADGKTILRLNSTPGIWHMLAIHKEGYEAMTGETHPEYNHWYFIYRVKDKLPAPITVRELKLQIEPNSTIPIPMRRIGSDAPARP